MNEIIKAPPPGTQLSAVPDPAPEDEATRRYRQMMARQLMAGSGPKTSQAIPATTGDAAWMNGVAAMLNGAVDGFRMRQAQGAPSSGAGGSVEGGQFGFGKAFGNIFGPANGGMKG